MTSEATKGHTSTTSSGEDSTRSRGVSTAGISYKRNNCLPIVSVLIISEAGDSGGNERTHIDNEQRRRDNEKQKSIDSRQRGKIERVSRVKVN
jgi:hypothetical protein